MSSRREFLQKSLLAGIGITVLGKSVLRANDYLNNNTFAKAEPDYVLPPLPYAYDALEPWIDVKTMQIHHDKHHQAYIDNLNKALKIAREKSVSEEPVALPGVTAPPAEVVTSDEETVKSSLGPLGKLEEMFLGASKLEPVIRNNGGGHWNHSFFWEIMKPAGKSNTPNLPSGDLAGSINTAFGSFEAFKNQFTKAAKERFGSGWAWLVVKDGQLLITSTPNQDNPLMDVADVQGKPILGLDVWEHAYYLKYQNVRADYITNWWNVVNWEKVAEHYVK